MINKPFFHVFSSGAETMNFLISEQDFEAAFNRVAICAAHTDAKVVCFALEDSHPHLLLCGEKDECSRFAYMFEDGMRHYLTRSRGTLERVSVKCSMIEITDLNYLKNVAVYVINQATKDGKAVLTFDYKWGSGSLYFRPRVFVSVWETDEQGNLIPKKRIGDLTVRQCRKMFHTHLHLPEDWIVCDGIILPQNYIDISLFEDIYRTHRCYQAFLYSNKNNDSVIERLAQENGISFETLEARKICEEECKKLYNVNTTRKLSGLERLKFAKHLRRIYGLTFKQLAALCHLPEKEIRQYLR